MIKTAFKQRIKYVFNKKYARKLYVSKQTVASLFYLEDEGSWFLSNMVTTLP
jgi:hypothetical protein